MLLHEIRLQKGARDLFYARLTSLGTVPLVMISCAACFIQAIPSNAMPPAPGPGVPTLCSDELLTWRGHERHCSGPWVYRYYECWRETRHERFGIETASGGGQEQRPRRCRLPRFGIERWEEIPRRRCFLARERYLRAEDNSWNHRPGDVKERLWNKCLIFAASISTPERRSKCLDEGENSKIFGEEIWDHSQLPHIKATIEGINYSIKTERPIYNEQESPLCGMITVSLPIYRLGRCRSAGLEPTNICGAPEERRYGAAGRRIEELPGEDEPWWGHGAGGTQCSSCEGSRDMAERASCLMEQLEILRADQRPMSEIADLENRLQVSFEMSQGPLPETIHSEVMRLTNRRNPEVLCGRTLPQGWAIALHDLHYEASATEATAYQVTSFCHRLAQPHVEPRLAAQYTDLCARNLPAIYVACRAQERSSDECFPREWMIEQLTNIFAKAFGRNR